MVVYQESEGTVWYTRMMRHSKVYHDGKVHYYVSRWRNTV